MLERDVPIYVEAVGQSRGSSEIEVRARVEGFLETMNFQEGSQVCKGQLLYTIDPRLPADMNYRIVYDRPRLFHGWATMGVALGGAPEICRGIGVAHRSLAHAGSGCSS